DRTIKSHTMICKETDENHWIDTDLLPQACDVYQFTGDWNVALRRHASVKREWPSRCLLDEIVLLLQNHSRVRHCHLLSRLGAWRLNSVRNLLAGQLLLLSLTRNRINRRWGGDLSGCIRIDVPDRHLRRDDRRNTCDRCCTANAGPGSRL